MDITKIWMTLQAYELSLKLPQYSNIRSQLESALAEINSLQPPQSKSIPAEDYSVERRGE